MRTLLALSLLLMTTPPAEASIILHIGDSHSVGPFGRLMDRSLRAIPGATVGLYGSCGSIARWWFTGTATPCGYLFVGKDGVQSKGTKASTPLASELLREYQPDVTIVELSANYVVGYEKSGAVADMRRMAQLIRASGSRCLWTSQPDSQKYRSESDRLKSWVIEAVGDLCQIVDGSAHTRYPDGMADGVHYGGAWGEQAVAPWVDAVMQELELMLSGN